MISWFAKNDVAANLMLIGIFLAGLFALNNHIPIEFFPSFESRAVSINVSLRGATPEDIELGVTSRIEEAIKNIEGIEEFTSRSTEGSSSVLALIDDDYDPRAVLDDIKSQVDSISTLPVDAERPIISLPETSREAISVVLSGEVSETELREQTKQLEDTLLLIPEITKVDINGIRDYEIAIELNEDRLNEYNISIPAIAQAINNSSQDISAGNINAAGGDVLLRSKGQAYRQNEFENIAILTQSNGTIIRLGDIADVKDSFEEGSFILRFNDRKAVELEIFSVGKQSVIEVADIIKDFVQDQQAYISPKYKLEVWRDGSKSINARINVLIKNAIQGGILVILLLSLFLRPAVAFWVFLGIPISFAGAFALMPIMGTSLNMLSLFAFIVVLGIVVDDAIVTGENVYTHLQKSKSGLDAAINGTKEVAVPVTFGVLTTVVAFLPLAFIEGARGVFFAQIPLIVIPVLLFSLIESKFVLPSHLKHINVNKDSSNRFLQWQQSFSRGFEKAILRYYRPILKLCLQNKASTISLFLGMLILTAVVVSAGYSRFVFFPSVPRSYVSLSLTMPTGTSFDVTDTAMEGVVKAAKQLQEKYIDPETNESIISHILSRTGGRGGATHTGTAQIQILDENERSLTISSPEIAREWRRIVGNIPGAEEVTFRAELSRSGDPIDIQITGSNYQNLQSITPIIEDHLASYEGVFDINSSVARAKDEIQIELKPEAYLLGMTRSSLLNQVRQAFLGLQAQRIQRGSDDIRVIVRLPKSDRQNLSSLQNMLISTPAGQAIPLTQLATLSPSSSPTVINRSNGLRIIGVRADIDKETVNMTTVNQSLTVFLDQLMAKNPGISYKLRGEQEEQAESLTSLLYGMFMLIFAIYCLLAIPFKSYTQPLVVMTAIPFGFVGGVMGHWIVGVNITIMSLMGMLALMGVLVNDSLVLVDYLNKARKKGMPLLDAVLTAGAARFRPVILTSLTTFFGLIPILFETDKQAQFLIPMAISLSFGILFTTFITLILIPVVYFIAASAKQRIRLFFKPQSQSFDIH